jgi:hypothetical protein
VFVLMIVPTAVIVVFVLMVVPATVVIFAAVIMLVFMFAHRKPPYNYNYSG